MDTFQIIHTAQIVYVGVLALAGLLSVLCFFGFIIFQAADRERLDELLKGPDWRKRLPKTPGYTLLGYILLSLQTIGGMLTFTAVLYSLQGPLNLLSFSGAFIMGFCAYFLFFALWQRVEKSRMLRKAVHTAIPEHKEKACHSKT